MLKKVVILLITLFLFSCPLFEEQGESPKKEDPVISEPIELTIISPTTNSEFGDSVTVSCLLSGNIGDIKSIGWTVSTPYTEILNEAVEIGNVDSKGLFSFTFPTKDYRSDLDIAINIENNAGEVVTKELKLLFGGEISLTLSAEPGNSFVNLSWNKIEGITEYTAYYSFINDFVNEEYYKEKQTTTDNKVTFNSLKNGYISHFIIVGKDSTGKKYYSDITSVVPHSTNIFTPAVFENRDRDAVEVYWNSYSDNVKYNVYRSNSVDGPYFNISGDVTGNNYIDNNVHFGKTYFYKVTPSVNKSDSTSPMAIRFAYDKATPYTIDVQGDVSFIEVDGDYAYTLGSQKLVISDLKNLRKLYTLNLENKAKNLRVRGDYIYILMDVGITVVKLKSSGSIISPVHISTYSQPNLLNIYPYKSNYLLATTNQSLIVLDTSNNSLLKEVGRYDNSDANRSFSTVVADESYAYIGTQSNTTENPIVKRVSLLDPLNPVHSAGDDYILNAFPEVRTIKESVIDSNYIYFIGEGIDHRINKETDIGRTLNPYYDYGPGYERLESRDHDSLNIYKNIKSQNTPIGLLIYRNGKLHHIDSNQAYDYYNNKLITVQNSKIIVPPDMKDGTISYSLNNVKEFRRFNNSLYASGTDYINEYKLDEYNKIVDFIEYKLNFVLDDYSLLVANDKFIYCFNSDLDLVIMNKLNCTQIITFPITDESVNLAEVNYIGISGNYLKIDFYTFVGGHDSYYYDLTTPSKPKKIEKKEGLKLSGQAQLVQHNKLKGMSTFTNLDYLESKGIYYGNVGNIIYYIEDNTIKYTELDFNN